jgi:hypothetical protein
LKEKKRKVKKDETTNSAEKITNTTNKNKKHKTN